VTRVFVPGDTTASALGADGVAAAIAEQSRARGLDLELVRNGSRGLFWLEPLIEVEVGGERFAYGPVAPADVSSLFESGLLDGGQHPLALGPTELIPYLRNQTRVNFARAGVIDPLSLEDYRRHDGFSGLAKALAMTGQQAVDIVKASGLRGRGGAAIRCS